MTQKQANPLAAALTQLQEGVGQAHGAAAYADEVLHHRDYDLAELNQMSTEIDAAVGIIVTALADLRSWMAYEAGTYANLPPVDDLDIVRDPHDAAMAFLKGDLYVEERLDEVIGRCDFHNGNAVFCQATVGFGETLTAWIVGPIAHPVIATLLVNNIGINKASTFIPDTGATMIGFLIPYGSESTQLTVKFTDGAEDVQLTLTPKVSNRNIIRFPGA
jgi:hypothetical protein